MNAVLAAQAGQGGAVTVACVNKAKTPLGVDFGKLTATLQKCYDQYFLPIWGYPLTLYNTANPKPSDWQFIYFDDADTAGALGYHDLTHNGQPISKIFVKTTLDDKQSVSVTACHELFEMAIDPIANLWAEAADGTEYAYEMCDPVEEDTFLVDGIEMSNFVHPAWFEPFKHPRGTKFDHLGRLTKPFSRPRAVTSSSRRTARSRNNSVRKPKKSALPRKTGAAIAANTVSAMDCGFEVLVRRCEASARGGGTFLRPPTLAHIAARCSPSLPIASGGEGIKLPAAQAR